MYKSLCLILLLSATFAFTSGSNESTASPSASSPAIVGQLGLNRSVPVTTKTFFNVTSSGLYRISAYLAMKEIGSGTGCPWNLDFGWTDDAGAEGPLRILQVSELQKPPNSFSFGPTGGYQQTLIVRAVAGSAVTYSIDDTGCPASGTYELYATAERLQ